MVHLHDQINGKMLCHSIAKLHSGQDGCFASFLFLFFLFLIPMSYEVDCFFAISAVAMLSVRARRISGLEMSDGR